MVETYYKSMNWNDVEDPIDKAAWEKLTDQFWLDSSIPVENDQADWDSLSQVERDLIGHVLGGLTLLDTLQSQDGNDQMRKDSRTQMEVANFNNIQFVESIHAKSYSSISAALESKEQIDAIFDWVNNNEYLQNKAYIINNIYQNGEPLQKKVASVFLESFLFYSGFYTPLYYLGNGKLRNVGEMIKLIIRDESVHGTYIGYKFQVGYNELSEEKQAELSKWMYDLLDQLYKNEEKYADQIYADVGWADDVKIFMRYNANKALMNLGQNPLFPDTSDDVNPIVMSGLSIKTKTKDLFSLIGSGDLLGKMSSLRR